ncbi:MAG: ABC transporter ATP-binding protein [Parvibaculaceae bacterium]|nr:ABC transporter ATP-binding protein [Parvibaculaceae bacterium]
MTELGTLDIRNVKKRFKVAGEAFAAIDDLSLTVEPGEFLSLVGPSGCGKSTLLRLVSGLDGDYGGEILLGGKRVSGTSLRRGLIFQEPRLFPWLNVEGNIALALENATLSAEQKRASIAEHVSLVGLRGFEKAYPRQLSGGMAQRAAIARGLVNRPALLLLDEPFGALDALTRTHMQRELEHIWKTEGITMVLVTHDVDEAIYLGDRVVVMAPRPGRISKIVDVGIGRPRDRASPAFTWLKAEVLEALGETHAS